VKGPFSGALDNDGDRLELWTAEGDLMSFVDYGDAEPWPETPDGLGPSLERISPLREEHDAEAWQPSIVVGGTPGAPNSRRVEDPEPPPAGTQFIPQGAVWRFFRGRSEPAATWTSIGFDDGSWESGAAGIGYGDGDDTTLLTDMQGSYTTVYARRDATANLRYKFGEDLRAQEKDAAIVVEDLAAWGLPPRPHGARLLLAVGDRFFVYPTKLREYQARYRGAFLHGGVTPEEMVLPIALLTPRRGS
jgi:hypothetical protein